MKITIHCPKCREPLADKFSAESCKLTFGSFILPMECLKCDLLMDVRVTVEDYDKDGNMNIDREMANVGKICSENPEWQFTLDYAFGKWSALFFESAVGYVDHGSADADTPAMAICLAAAKTTDHDKEG